ncbi:hypothetical protein B0J18DRAFT_406163 [Chaetomium sp. MPI-SDFR-AT-0129]|nr:hypothetical protein B0J18DRAFT_406163 [Chaetomium sp. MPI-SDFR-AT-0129]
MDSFSTWFTSFASCCGPREKKPRFSIDRNIVVLRDQPAVISPPTAEPLWMNGTIYETPPQRAPEPELPWLRRPRSRDGSIRRNLFPSSATSVRRLQISGPTDFRHLQSDSFQFPPEPSRPRPRSFRPIELSIYQPNNRLSDIMPHIDCNVTPPPRAHTANSSKWDASSGTTLHNERSYSTMSFHIPRKHTRQSSGISDASMSPPKIPPKSRARASTAPNTERIVARIASAMIEKDQLQARINFVVERQSMYFGNRPSTAYDMRNLEPMPSIPALPAAGPSFAERLSVDDRPRTAPSHMSSMEKTLEFAAAAAQAMPPVPQQQQQPQQDTSRSNTLFTGSPASNTSDLERPLAPPLPLVLRPPLRKKKSFSRVSNWLFTPGEEDSTADNDSASPTMIFGTSTGGITSITTSPRPIKASDGFYQCVAPPEGLPRTSMETSSSVYTWETGGDDEDGQSASGSGIGSGSETEARTVPTTNTAWSPEQTPKQGTSSRHTSPPIGYTRTDFDKETGVGSEGNGVGGGLGVVMGSAPRPVSVGVAF